MVNFLWDRGRPRPPVTQKASGRKLFVLRTRAGEGARGPSKSGYQRPNLEFQPDPLPEVVLNCERVFTMLGFGHFALNECLPFFRQAVSQAIMPTKSHT